MIFGLCCEFIFVPARIDPISLKLDNVKTNQTGMVRLQHAW